MNIAEARAKLEAANVALCLAALTIKDHQPLLEAFFEEKRLMESAGSIIDPTLWRNQKRQEAEALLSPVYRAALDFLAAHEAAREKAGGQA